ncbi:MAG: hypothetical protein ACI4TB_05060 [Lachnospiraceae bacterium]
MKKEFKEAYGKIQAPNILKAETLELMETEKKKVFPKGHKVRTKRRIVWSFGAAVAVLCAVFLCLVFLPRQGAIYITPMEDGVYYDRVELEDGVLTFHSERVIISVTPNAGNITGGEKKTEETDTDGEEGCLAEEVTTQSGGTIVFCKEDSLTLPEIPEADWSYIDGQRVYVTALKTETIRYQATFERDGKVCEITGEGVTQKEFIDYLYKKIKE